MIADTRKKSGRTRCLDQGPERMCIVTRARAHPSELIRFALGPDNHVVPDIAGKLPGRGVWVGCRQRLVDDAVKRKGFARGFKAQVSADADLPDLVSQLLRRHALQALSLANKAGLVLTGHSKVSGALETGDVAALVQASDAAEGGRDRLSRKQRAIVGGDAADASAIEEFTIDELSLALGRPNVVHAAVRQGSASMFFVQAAQRLQRYRSQAPIESQDSKPEEQIAVDGRVSGLPGEKQD